LKTGTIIALIIIAVLIIAIVVLYFLGKRAQKKQEEQKEAIEAAKQSVSMFIIDKKRMKLKDAGFPQSVLDQTPKLMRNAKVSVLKAKVGPQTMSLICDDKIFESVPVKKEVKASVSGMYVTEVKALHGKPIVVEQKKKSRFKQALERAQEKAGAKPIK